MSKTNREILSSLDIKFDESEADFQHRVVTLARLKGWSVYAVPDSRRATMAGYPDLTMFNPQLRRLIFAELKREKGKLAPAQVDVLARLVKVATKVAFEVYVWRPSDWDAIVKTLGA